MQTKAPSRRAAGGRLRKVSSQFALGVVACASIFVWGSIATLLGSILPTLATRANLSMTQVGHVFLANGLGLVIASLLAGPLVDVWGKKGVLLAGAGLVVGSLLLLSRASALPTIAFLAFTLGAGGSALVTGANAAVSDLYPEKRESALNFLNFFFGVGAFVTPFAIVPLEQSRGLMGVLVALAVFAGVSFLLSASTRFPAPLRSRTWSLAEATTLVRNPGFLLLGAILFFYVGVEISIWNWQVTFLTERFALDRYVAARALSGFAITLMIGRLISNRLLLVWPATHALLASTLGGAVCLGLTYGAQDFRLSFASFLAAGLFLASVFPTAVGLLGRSFPALSGTATGFGITCAWVGALVVPPAIGYVAGIRGLRTGTMLIVVAAVLLALLAAAVYRKQRGPQAVQG